MGIETGIELGEYWVFSNSPSSHPVILTLQVSGIPDSPGFDRQPPWSIPETQPSGVSGFASGSSTETNAGPINQYMNLRPTSKHPG